MLSYSVFLPSYSVGEDCYQQIPYVTRKYGKTAVVIGGKTAMEKARQELDAAVQGSDVQILDYIWYGGDSNYENVEMLKADSRVQEADMLFGVGGGRACDTVKTLADMLDKPFFTFPTLASNCAACTAITVMYNPDGSFKEYYYMHAPSYHTFVNTKIIADSPEKLLWAGIGDALSKECEVLFASRDKFIYHTPLMGQCISKVCTTPLVEYGAKALEACRNNKPDFALEQVAILSFQRGLFQILQHTKTSRIRRTITITTVHWRTVFTTGLRHCRSAKDICTVKLYRSVCFAC